MPVSLTIFLCFSNNFVKKMDFSRKIQIHKMLCEMLKKIYSAIPFLAKVQSVFLESENKMTRDAREK